MDGKRESWCGLVVRQDGISVCLPGGREGQQVRSFPNTPEDCEALARWLKAEGCSHVALRPDHEAWQQVHGTLKRHFQVKVIHAQPMAGASQASKACAQWLAQLLKSGRLDKLDQVEPIGDRFPHSDEDALGGQPGKKPEHSGQGPD
ncbi:MAG: hypothetical protein ACE15E_20915 [Acidobacteriota bacterium]